IYDILGRRVRALLNAPLPAGEHQVVWDGRNDHGDHVASGIYLYRITAGSFVSVKKMLMVR
ncbi:MAG: FlgD immunoglobulin-like domain containing protein, partial [Bacteroidota bacterium]